MIIMYLPTSLDNVRNMEIVNKCERGDGRVGGRRRIRRWRREREILKSIFNEKPNSKKEKDISAEGRKGEW